jgi:hypothetical protein
MKEIAKHYIRMEMEQRDPDFHTRFRIVLISPLIFFDYNLYRVIKEEDHDNILASSALDQMIESFAIGTQDATHQYDSKNP